MKASPPVPQIPQTSNAFQQNIDILGSLSSPQPPSKSSTPVPAFSQATATPPPPAADPFASLVSASPRHQSPFPSGSSVSSQPPASSSLLDLAGAAPAAKPKAEEDEWNFASSLPESNSLPSTNRVQVLNSSLKVELLARRHPQQQRQIHLVASFSNATSQPLNDLHFQVAVEKVSLSLSLSLFLSMANVNQIRHTHYTSGRSPAATSAHSKQTACNRKCSSTASTWAKATP